jgi:hypothetical protein
MRGNPMIYKRFRLTVNDGGIDSMILELVGPTQEYIEKMAGDYGWKIIEIEYLKDEAAL